MTREELIARTICNAHRRWEGRSPERQQEVVDAAWQAHMPEARAVIALDPAPSVTAAPDKREEEADG